VNGASVSIIIVNWNGGDHLRRCLASLRGSTDESLDRIIVVDNGSTDGSSDAARNVAGVTVLDAGRNLGFAKACNLGARETTAEFLLFLNPDTTVSPGVLPRVLSFMTETSSVEVGICGVQLVDEEGRVARSCARFPTPLGMCLVALGLGRIFRGSGMLMEDWPHDRSRQVDHVIGAFYFVRKSVFEALRGFDERFFMYLEDLDFSLRANRLGWRSHYLADTCAFHLGGGTSRQVKDRRLFYSLRSRVQYSFKHFDRSAAAIVFMLTVILEPVVRTGWAAVRFSWGELIQTIGAYRLLYQWIFRVSQP
jgi:GT2 family glycosyltransferase